MTDRVMPHRIAVVPMAHAAGRLRPRLLFARNFFANPRRVGSVIPSSRRLIQRMLGQTDWQQIKVAVEYGPGTGCITRALLARLGPDARLFAFEINMSGIVGVFINDHFKQSIMPVAVRQAIVRATASILAPGAHLIGYQYSTSWLRELRRDFRHVAVQIEPRNWPPAFVFTACGD